MAIERNVPGELPVNALEPNTEDAEFDVLMELPEGEEPAEEEPEEEVGPQNFNDNLAEFLSEKELTDIGSTLVSDVEADRESMSEWEEILISGMKLLGFKLDDKEMEVFPDSCTVSHPLLAESVVKYQAKARSQILNPAGIARSKILGKTLA